MAKNGFYWSISRVTTVYIYTLLSLANPNATFSLLSGYCSCGGLLLSVTSQAAWMVQLTQMEVVVLCVAKGNEADDNVGERCNPSVLVFSDIRDHGIRRPDGFLPMCFFA